MSIITSDVILARRDSFIRFAAGNRCIQKKKRAKEGEYEEEKEEEEEKENAEIGRRKSSARARSLRR